MTSRQHRSSRQVPGRKHVAQGTRNNVAKLLLAHCKKLGVDPPAELTEQLAIGRLSLRLAELYGRLEYITRSFTLESFVQSMLQVCSDQDELDLMTRDDGLLALMESATVVAALVEDDHDDQHEGG